MMETDTTLLLDLDERNLAHFLAALALSKLARCVEGSAIQTEFRRCWWPSPDKFAIHTEYEKEQFRLLLFNKAYDFLRAMKWYPGLGSAASGLLASGSEIGVNPFIALSDELGEITPLKGFSARVLPGATLYAQLFKLQAPANCSDWLNQLGFGVGSWGFDCRVNLHASDAGISSDAEGSGHLDPVYPAIELLSLAATAFFVPIHAWQVERNSLRAFAWMQPIPLPMTALAASGRIHGLPTRKYQFYNRGAAHGKGSAYHYFPPAILQPLTL